VARGAVQVLQPLPRGQFTKKMAQKETEGVGRRSEEAGCCTFVIPFSVCNQANQDEVDPTRRMTMKVQFLRTQFGTL
jgi:hypothetical protein